MSDEGGSIFSTLAYYAFVPAPVKMAIGAGGELLDATQPGRLLGPPLPPPPETPTAGTAAAPKRRVSTPAGLTPEQQARADERIAAMLAEENADADAEREADGMAGPDLPPGYEAPDPSTGGSVSSDPAEESRAATDATKGEESPPDETLTVTATRNRSTLRGFTDHTFVLMQMANLINARNEKLDPALIDEQDEDLNTLSTLKALKKPLPYAYHVPENKKAKDAIFLTKLENAAIQCYGEPHSFLNYMTAWPGYQRYLDSTTADISKLATKIRLFKVFHEDGREEAVEIVFPTSGISGQELEELLKNGSKRGYGSGIKSFNFTLDGTNPLLRTRSVSATLVIYADSMETLLKPRFGGMGNMYIEKDRLHYRYTDLAMKTDTVPGKSGGTDTDGSFGALDDLDYKILVEVGLAKGSGMSSKLNGHTSMALSLGPVTHSYDIGQDGSITLTIDYKGYIEKEFSNPVVYDVFASVESQADDLYKQLGAFGITQTCGTKASKKFNEQVLAEGNKRLKDRVSSLMTQFRKEGGIYYIKIEDSILHAYNVAFNSYEKKVGAATTGDDGKEKKELSAQDKLDIEKAYETLQKALGAIAKEGEEGNSMANSMSNSGDLAESDRKAAEIEKAAEDKEDGEEKTSLKRCAVDPNNTQVAYFYAGDLINHILSRLSEIYSPHGIEEITSVAEKKLFEDPAFAEIMGAMDAAQANAKNYVNESLEGANNIAIMLGYGTGSTRDKEFKELQEEEAQKVVAAATGPLKEIGVGMNDIKNKFSARGERFKKFRVVLGPVMFNDFFSTDEIMCSIGDIPIALNHFNSWLADEVEGKNKYRIGLADFLNKFISHYLRSHLLGDKKLDQGVITQKKSFSSMALTAYNPRSTKGVDALTAHRTNIPSRRGLLYEKVPQAKRPILDTTGTSLRANNAKESYEYMVFFEKMVHPVMLKNAKAAALSHFGISMFQHGRDRGILKTAQYQATNIQGRKEARHQAGKFNGLEQLTEVFDVTLNCYADLQKFPGHRIYLDAKSLVPYLSKETLESLHGYQLEDFGVGGFYVINSVQHNFEQGKFDTIIRAQWEMWQKNKPKKQYSLETQAGIDEIQKPIKEACKSVMAPEGGSLGELYDAARAVAESIFGENVTNKIVGFFKGLTDVFDGEDPELIMHSFPSQNPEDYSNWGNADENPESSTGGSHDGPQGVS
tara:strand:- start:3163 stop:6729 length:3567 start_codon:yes stop_codon:yes gene_type:complete